MKNNPEYYLYEWSFTTTHSVGHIDSYGAKKIDSSERVALLYMDNSGGRKYYVAHCVPVKDGDEILNFWFEIILTYGYQGWISSIEWTASSVFDMKMYIEGNKFEPIGITYKLEFNNGVGLLDYDMSNEELNKFLYSDTIGEAVYNLTEKLIYRNESQ